MVTYLSVCSGIEAASVAWHGLGWSPVAFSEIEAFPSAVLRTHYPGVPNWGDMTKFQEWPDANIDLLVGGTPCQSFSVAGLRKGLADPRGNLALTYLAIVDRYRPRWVVWENVPGVLSSAGGRDFGAFLGGLGQLGYGWAYRVLDAQYFGVAQRRRRVFVVGCLGGWQRAAAVLFERHSLSGHPAPRRETRESVTGTLGARTRSGGEFGTDFECAGGLIASTGDVAACLETTSHDYSRADGFTMIAHALRGEGFDASEDGRGRGMPIIPAQPYALAIRGRGESHQLEYRQDGTANAILTPNGGRAGIGVGAIAHAFDARQSDVVQYGDLTGPLDTDGHSVGVMQPVAIHPHCVGRSPDAGPQGKEYMEDGSAYCLDARGVPQAVAIGIDEEQNARVDGFGTLKARMESGGFQGAVMTQAMAVRRLTPRECERLQGFPDDYTLISYRNKPAADGPRYKALGNSMAVPVMRWIGQRIQEVDRVER